MGAPRDLTGVGAVANVHTNVGIQMHPLPCAVPTPRVFTGEGALLRVGAHVHLESSPNWCTEPALGELAREWATCPLLHLCLGKTKLYAGVGGTRPPGGTRACCLKRTILLSRCRLPMTLLQLQVVVLLSLLGAEGGSGEIVLTTAHTTGRVV